MSLSSIRWTKWGSTTARGRGRFTYKTCEPSCADGGTETVAASFRLYRARRNCPLFRDGRTVVIRHRVFTRVEVFDGQATTRTQTGYAGGPSAC